MREERITSEVCIPRLSLLLPPGRKYTNAYIFPQFTMKLKGICFPLVGKISRIFFIHNIHPE